MEIKGTTPQQDQYRVAPEWHAHQQAYMMWPERTDNWRDGAKPTQKVFAEVAGKISKYEPLTMLVSREQYEHALHTLPESVRVVEMSYNDAWMRDVGPTYLVNQHDVRAVNWQFNAWGGLVDGLYFPWNQDDLVSEKVSDLDRIDHYDADFVLEGSAYQTDGEGTLIATEESVLSEGRNGQIDKEAVEAIFKRYLNVSTIIWLKRGYFMDETNGDVDNMVNFVRPGEVALTWTEDQTDPMYEICHEALAILSAAKDAHNRPLTIYKVQMPKPLLITKQESEGVDPVNGRLPRYAGDRLMATYINCYLANGAVILPIFGDVHDQAAIEQYQQIFPNRKIEPIYARELLLGGGDIHSIVLGVPD
ncbi:agmatine deiminase [Lentilactobacillus parakefiri]|uniref:Putative agmatine deiminase n=1 Tax=Lentilactobacillus parakefiri TaxID=152332 RepID=A0A269YDG9_9LACO|nr:agmatine deiminase [Lentilactobacillus parakefiri]PAK83568.1 agmatine deiminase [Lentilactobacillus parakefiri]